MNAVTRVPGGEGGAKGGRNLTGACTRPPTRKLLYTIRGLGRRVMPGVRWLQFRHRAQHIRMLQPQMRGLAATLEVICWSQMLRSWMAFART